MHILVVGRQDLKETGRKILQMLSTAMEELAVCCLSSSKSIGIMAVKISITPTIFLTIKRAGLYDSNDKKYILFYYSFFKIL